MMSDATTPLDAVSDEAETLRRDGHTVMYLAGAGRVLALFGVVDPVKATTAEAIRALQADGLRVVMLTGDNETTARAVATRLGLDDVRADVLPRRQARGRAAAAKRGRVVAMAGDGINDAPALAAGGCRHRHGHRHRLAIESAGITLVRATCRSSCGRAHLAGRR